MYSGSNLTIGSNNINIGYNSQPTSAIASNEVTLGNSSSNYYRMYTSGWSYASDAKLKHNIRDISVGLDFVKKLRPVEFIYNNASNEERSLGFIAQEVQKVINSAGLVKSGMVTPFENTLLGLKTTELIPILTRAIQEQQEQISILQKTIEIIPELTRDIQAQQKEIDKLKRLIHKS